MLCAPVNKKQCYRDRWRVDGCGQAYCDSKSFHLVIRRGSQPGQKHILEGEGDETVDTQAGDLVFVLQQKRHACFRRSGVHPRWLTFTPALQLLIALTLFGTICCMVNAAMALLSLALQMLCDDSGPVSSWPLPLTQNQEQLWCVVSSA